MARRRQTERRQVTVRVALAPDPMPPEALEAAERLFARWAVRAHLAENPHLLPSEREQAGPKKGASDG